MDKAIEHILELIQEEKDPHGISLLSAAILSMAQAKEIIQRNTPYTK